VSVDMDVVGVMAAYSDPLCVCVVHCIGRHFLYSTNKPELEATLSGTYTLHKEQ